MLLPLIKVYKYLYIKYNSLKEIMKIININESQKKRLFEAYDGKFSFKKLDMHPDLNAMVIYCDEHLGESFATGSSRYVYMLSDNFVLK